MAKMFGAFGTNKLDPLVNDLRVYLLEVMDNPERYNPAVMAGFKQNFIVRFNERINRSLLERNREYFGDAEPPALLMTLKDRYVNIWQQQMNRTFATANDSILGHGIGSGASRLTIVTNIIRELLGLEPIVVVNARALGLVRLTRNLKRVFRQPLDSYLQMLLNTVPRNFIRDYERLRGNLLIKDDVLYRVSPHAIKESADACRFVSNKVLTPDALDLIRDKSKIAAPLFHPNCFVPDTPVLTSKGVRAICEIGYGTSVDLGGGIFQPVTGALVREYCGEVITIGYGRFHVTSTPEHLYLTERGWSTADKVGIGTQLVNKEFAEFPICVDGTVFESKYDVALFVEKCVAALIYRLSRPVSVRASVNFNVQVRKNKVQYPAPYSALGVKLRECAMEQSLVGVKLCLKSFAIRLRSLLLNVFDVAVATVIYEMLLRRATRQSQPPHDVLDAGRAFEAHHGGNPFSGDTFFVIDPLQKGFDFARVLTRKWTSIASYSQSYYSGDVFDLTVPTSSCYIAGETFVHNCRHSIAVLRADRYKGSVITVADINKAIRHKKIRPKKPRR